VGDNGDKKRSRPGHGGSSVAAGMTLLEYSLLATSSLLAIVDPIAVVPTFLAMTPQDTPAQRIKMARLACAVTAGVLWAFAFAGKWIFRLLGITIPAFQLAGSVVLLLVALDMVRARRSAVRETTEETEAAMAKEDVAITPLAVPMLAGPGAITTAILLHNQAQGLSQRVALCGSILVVAVVCYLVFRWSAKGARWLSPIALKIGTRIMGLLLAAVAMQFAINALTQLKGVAF
jgi:multiple antibiotic resistance protein